ncbi:flagellin [Alkalicoccus urumqiensis]|uniref:Flagellin n=1 Tax=Alkalicoccus urumqiensis TaxID=1548213 RepID=A0A2P6MHA4_ALKUR|nr:flagellin [Alkalicoccus urumqiensis]PRO65658.1 flagellin [Alkalicoccus urumqiensis]
MIINTNVSAMNAHRQMGANQNAQQSSMEKLSSGLRINRAGDDAAGLAISEKMRAQINGLDQASRNAQDGISMIQTAEGALDESHSILQRMRELSVQSANDTNVEVDREELQKEVDQLSEELDRISETTQFNTQELLDGTLESTFQIGANEGQNMEIAIDDMSSSALGVGGNEAASFSEDGTVTTDTDQTEFTDGTYSVVEMEDYEGTDLAGDAEVGSGAAADVSHLMVDSEGEAIAVSDGGTQFYAYDGTDNNTNGYNDIEFNNVPAEVTVTEGGTEAVGDIEITDSDLSAGTYSIADISNDGTFGDNWDVGLKDANGEIVALGATDPAGGSGNSATSADLVTNWVDTADTTSTVLEHNANDQFGFGDTIEVSGNGIDISSQASADSAITDINDAIETVSAQRSELGSFQNRLEHTISNLDNSSENLSAAESRIRDVDMAAEMMEQTRANILSQASQSMLAQANQQPQSVLQLLG